MFEFREANILIFDFTVWAMLSSDLEEVLLVAGAGFEPTTFGL